MRHYGDITKLNGAELPIVDIITGGSPCQDLSIAGNRAGLAGERSGLFLEQIRIIKEMREHDKANRGANVDIRSIRPRYCIWENVSGSLSSPGKDKRGEDFRRVLEEFARVADPTAVIPRPTGGRWSNSGCILGNGWSIAWLLHNGQFWGKSIVNNRGELVKAGTPQRRRRIALVADFGGESAPSLLFESSCLHGHFDEGAEKRETFAGEIGTCADSTISFQERAGCEGGGKGILIQENRIGALQTHSTQYVLSESVGHTE